MLYYDLAPPNDHYNNEEEDSHLSGMRHETPLALRSGAKTRHVYPWITADIIFEPTDKRQYNLTDAWCGYVFDELLRNSPTVVQALEFVAQKGYVLLHQKKLRVEIDKLFNSSYRNAIEQREVELAAIFYDNNPGKYSGFRGCTVEKVKDSLSMFINSEGCVEKYTEEIVCPPMTNEEWLKARRSFGKALPLVVEWCMNDFSYRRSNWLFDNTNAPVRDIMGVDLGTEWDTEENSIKKIAKQQPPEPKVITADDIAKQQHKKLIATLKRKGKYQDVSEFM